MLVRVQSKLVDSDQINPFDGNPFKVPKAMRDLKFSYCKTVTHEYEGIPSDESVVELRVDVNVYQRIIANSDYTIMEFPE